MGFFGQRAAVLGMLVLGSLALPAAAQVRENNVEIAQTDMCRQVRGDMVIYSEPSVDAEVEQRLSPGDRVTIVSRTPVQPDEENFRFVEVATPTPGWMVLETRLTPGGPLQSTLMMCSSATPTTPIRGLW
ncbi:hypothetical protein PN462_20280 [Spirulina sp. CS-785/01]|uniref:hypothetical protein n=1 Tax=Spirulina sp. CS-785/01 TaxID=3021716 RepID=UPI00232C6AD7|nr:hypothetical protein [Spirulina sp. CS-785/01]MDB9315463.1 hypothetical protein [Spirulina sp. CS-785/01]